VRKILPPPEFEPRTVQPVANRYTDYAIAVHRDRSSPTYYWKPLSHGRLVHATMKILRNPSLLDSRSCIITARAQQLKSLYTDSKYRKWRHYTSDSIMTAINLVATHTVLTRPRRCDFKETNRPHHLKK
jgi:hypothetical protein